VPSSPRAAAGRVARMRADATCYRHPDRRAAVACQRCGRPICTSCMTQASIGFHCPDDAKAGRQRVYTAQTLPGLVTKPVVTLGLIAVNVAVFVVGLGMGEDVTGGGRDSLTTDGGLFGPLVDQGEWYRLLTSGFLHASILHIGFNMYLLYLLGQQLEPVLGRVRFGLVYLFALLSGALGVLLVSPRDLTVGASGAVFGLMGVAVVLQRSRGISPFDSGLGGLILINLVITFLVPNISIGGHIGGLVGGLVAGWLLIELPPRVPGLPAWAPSVVVAGLGFLVVGASFWAAAQWMDPVFT
jgi:membrane associated rhomboid family serine protease